MCRVFGCVSAEPTSVRHELVEADNPMVRQSEEHDSGPAAGDTDSERLFNLLIRDFDPGDAAGSLRRTISTAVQRSPFSGVNFLFSDGERLYAYRLGIFELH